MKTTRFTRTLSLVIAFVLFVCAFTGTAMTSSASEELFTVDAELPVPTSNLANVQYGGYLHLAVELVLPAGDYEYGIFVYPTSVDPANFSKTEPIHQTFNVLTSTPENGDPVKFCTTQGIAAKDIETLYRIVPVTRDRVSGAVNFGESFDYSIAEYCSDRVDDDGITEAQINLCNKTLEYGAAAKEILGAN